MRQPQNNPRVTILGAGLAGSEAAWQLAQQGIGVDLFEMRPVKTTPAHQTGNFAELVCSNSFGADTPFAASWLLKQELERLGAFVLSVARTTRVPAGGSLAMDRDEFSQTITRILRHHANITVHEKEVTKIDPDQPTLIATGPLTSPDLCQSLASLLGTKSLYFYDAISPIVAADSLDLSQMFFGNRYGKGETPDFLNIPLSETEYHAFVDDLLSGEVVLPHDFEEAKYFESCLPIETIAERGRMTLAFGPMKPVGLEENGKRAFAVIQLRTENKHKTAYNLVGFQTKLKYPEQMRIFRKLPGLENAEFLRLGSMHRNTYINSPRHLAPTLQLRDYPNVFIAGQLTGTEGYLESSATGWLAGNNLARLAKHEPLLTLPEETMLGALLAHITDPSKIGFQPMNSNYGILPPLNERVKGKNERNERMAKRALLALELVTGGLPSTAGRIVSTPATSPGS